MIKQRRDLGDVGQVARDEDHRAVLADRPRERHGGPGEHGRSQGRQHDAGERLQPGGAQGRGRLLDVEVEVLDHGLNRADDERQAHEGERHEHAQGRERDLDPQGREVLPDQAVGSVDRRQRDARHGGRQRERQVDDGVEHPLEWEVVAHQHPGHERTHDQVDHRRRERRTEAQPECRQHPGVGGDVPELGPAQRGRAQEHRRKRDEDDQAQIDQGHAQRRPEARDDAGPPDTEPYGEGRGHGQLAGL